MSRILRPLSPWHGRATASENTEDAAARLEQGLAADQAARVRRQANWEWRLALARHWQEPHRFHAIESVLSVLMCGLFILGSMHGKVNMGWWIPCSMWMHAGFRLLARIAERRILTLAKHEGIDLPNARSISPTSSDRRAPGERHRR